MPYYCTVPRCTSMAGKAKNVSFHQFPRDEELAKLWNRILKRGKPYTKYSKVCSLHFKPEDYTITSVGKNKGQWRTLRKDAIPSQNLPSDSPVPYTPRRHSRLPNLAPGMVDPMVQQMAQAIYMQTMLAMQAAGTSEPLSTADQPSPAAAEPSPSSSSHSDIEVLLRGKPETEQKDETYQCQECSKCFKDPDVFVLHKRVHSKDRSIEKLPLEKENFSANIQQQETLKANPILANLLKSSVRLDPDNINPNVLETNVLTIENQIMTALASNMEAYIRTLSSMLANQNQDTGDIIEKCDDTGVCGNENDSVSDAGNDETDVINDKCSVEKNSECNDIADKFKNECSENEDERIGDVSEMEKYHNVGVSENHQAPDCDNTIDNLNND